MLFCAFDEHVHKMTTKKRLLSLDFSAFNGKFENENKCKRNKEAHSWTKWLICRWSKLCVTQQCIDDGGKSDCVALCDCVLVRSFVCFPLKFKYQSTILNPIKFNIRQFNGVKICKSDAARTTLNVAIKSKSLAYSILPTFFSLLLFSRTHKRKTKLSHWCAAPHIKTANKTNKKTNRMSIQLCKRRSEESHWKLAFFLFQFNTKKSTNKL